jgi:hypothetical protein
MTSQDPSDPPRTLTDPNRRAGWGIGALVVVARVMAAIVYAMNRSPTSTATGPSTTQSAPSTTAQGGGANTGAAR